MSDAYRGSEEAARARLAELQLEREKRLAHFDELGIPPPIKKDRRAREKPDLTPPDRVRVTASLLVMLVIAAALMTGHPLEAGLFVGVLLAFNLGYAPYFFRAAERALAQIPKVPPHVNEFKDPEPLNPPENRPVQRVLTTDEQKARELEIEAERLAYEEIEQEIEEAEALLNGRAP